MGARQSRKRETNIVAGNHSLYTVTAARLEREKQGPWEVEVSYGGEADLHRHLAACNKNPGHLNFVHVDKFNVEHLPSDFQDNDIVDLVRAMSDLTVRVSVKYVSENRPVTVPGSDKPYPFYSGRRRGMMRVGTGFVYKVVQYPNKHLRHEFCRCKECLNSPARKTQFACIYINTAAHVVYDQLEGAHTTCHLFFDRAGTPDTCSGVVTLNGTSDVWPYTDRDFCEMVYDTHDMELADRLDIFVKSRKYIYRSIYRKYSVKSFSVSNIRGLWSATTHPNKLAIIVSHPHGCSKQVTVGHYCTSMNRWIDTNGELTYTTATCPGSSGAPVYLLGGNLLWQFEYFPFHHCGNCDSDKELNFSNRNAVLTFLQ